MKYVAGIDGGGTKTHCALYDTEGNRIDVIEWGATNHECLPGGFGELKTELGKLLDSLMKKNMIGLEQIETFVFGMAGDDTVSQHRTISGIIESFGIKKYILCNDSFLGIKAGCTAGYGICAINGTGCTVAGIDPGGRMLQIGGQGSLTGDKGGGGYIVSTAIERVYSSLFKNGLNTIMKDMLFSELGISSEYDFLETATHRLEQDKSMSKTICGLVFDAANKGDNVALQLLEEIGANYFECICGLLKRLDFKSAGPLEIILTGSIFVKGENTKIIDTITEKTLKEHKDMDIKFKVLKAPPVAGAVAWGLESLSGVKHLHEKVIKSFL